MRKVFLHFLLSLSLALTAAPVGRRQALELARQFMADRQFDEPTLLDGSRLSKAPAAEPPIYVFNATDGKGFVVVSNDDRTPAVLGYSTQGSMNPETMPDDVRWWLNGYERAITSLDDDAQPVRMKAPVRQAVSPLVKTAWDQGEPYNNLCPMLNGERCITGCVATAMAQVINYHRWPKAATSSVDGYTTENKIVMQELPPTTFPWSNMSEDDIARLNLYCGQSTKMEYSPTGSGTSAILAMKALAEVFGYDQNIHYIMRSSYGDVAWEDQIYEELRNRRPVIYSGQDPKYGGHCFICDGYDGNGYFHINWGWSGWCDTYFLFSSLTPDSGDNDDYTNEQQAVIGIQPPTGEEAIQWPMITVCGLEVSKWWSTSYSRSNTSSDFSPSVKAEFTNTSKADFTGSVGYRVYQDDTPVTDVLGVTSFSKDEKLEPGYYYYGTEKVSFGKGLDDGVYRIVPVYKASGSKAYVPAEGADVNYFEAIIKGTKMTLSVKTRANVVEDNPETPVDPTATGEMWWGYFNGSEEMIPLGTGYAETFDAAIYVPAGNVFVSNNTIKALRIYMGDVSVTSDVKVWISTSLPENVSKASYVQSVDMSALVDGANDIVLDKPYEVEGKGVYIGYSMTISEGDFLVMQGGDNMRNALFLRASENLPSWMEMTSYGKLALMALVEGGPFPNNIAVPVDFSRHAVPLGGEGDVFVNVTNGGKDPIESLSYTVTTDGITSVEETIAVSPAITYGVSRMVPFAFAADANLGLYDKTLTITKVNGNDNIAGTNTANGQVQTVAELKYWPRTVLIETFATEQSYIWPLADEYLNATLTDCPDLAKQVAVVTHHVGNGTDWLTVEESNSYLWLYNSSEIYTPAFMWDRHAYLGHSPVMGARTAEGNRLMIERRLADLSRAGIELTAELNEEKTAVTVTAACERGFDFSEQPQRMTVCLTEDRIAPRQQLYAPDDFIHQHVLRAVNEEWGSELDWKEDKAVYSCTFDIDASWKPADLKVIAFVNVYDNYDPSNCAVENAAVVSLRGQVLEAADVNGDGNVDVGDVMAIINYMAGQTNHLALEEVDVNGDGSVDVGDVMAVINYMASEPTGGTEPNNPTDSQKTQ